ncbi:hypothetical protein OG271_17055 [Micromonospora rifamycinica]|uniref:hypothetical protein n=1 Tax=Micromonospora rifamycinica TaxID=291594 RepID=UPI002E298E5E|nr:hypothetical protein [Micromonospora rifamycinica]
MRLPHTPGLAKRSVQHLRYRTGLIRSVHAFRRERVERITLVVPDSLGDIAINSAVTRAIRLRGAPAEITLLTDRKYESAVAFNRDYDAVALLDGYTDKPPWTLTYQDQLAAAKALTPAMDALVLCQPGAWCDALWSRYHSLDIQYRLSGTPPALRRLPRLTVPAGAAEAVRPIRQRAVGRTAFIAPGAFTLKFGAAGERFFTELAARLVGAGWQVFWNGAEAPSPAGGPPGDTGSVVAVGHLPLAEVVALASSCERAVCARSGLVDVITFCTPELPQYVLYPRTRYPYSRRPVRECYSLRAMGGVNVCESENSLDTDADLSAELATVGQWLESPRKHTESTS